MQATLTLPNRVQPLVVIHRRTTLARWLVRVALLSLLVFVGLEVWRVTLGPNFHTVIGGRLYRAAQPSASTLSRYIHKRGLRAVINLRGGNAGEDWFDEEKEVVQRLGVDFVSVNLSASDKPQEAEVRNLVAALERLPTPLLIHCNSGSDRTGFACAAYLLLRTDATFEEARAQLSLRYGHFSWGRAGCQGQILDQYKGWLAAQGLPHEPSHFRRWACEVYIKDDWPKPN